MQSLSHSKLTTDTKVCSLSSRYSYNLFIWSRASPRSHLHKKFHSITYNVLSCVYMRASPVRRDPAFAHPRSRLPELVFLHINSAARNGSRADIVHNINFKRALVHSLNFEAGWRRKRSRQADDCTKKKQFSSCLQGYFSHHYYFPL